MVISPSDDILERLQAGEDPSLVLASLQPAGVRTALRFVAPLRWVTDHIWCRVIQPHGPEIGLDAPTSQTRA